MAALGQSPDLWYHANLNDRLFDDNRRVSGFSKAVIAEEAIYIDCSIAGLQPYLGRLHNTALYREVKHYHFTSTYLSYHTTAGAKATPAW